MIRGLLLGVDGGGTKTDALLADDAGEVVGRGRAGPSNHEHVGFPQAGSNLVAAVRQALQHAGAAAGDLRASAWGLSGLDWPSDQGGYSAQLAPLLLGGPTVLVNDAFVALRVGAAGGVGIVVNSGTGVIAAGRTADGRTFRTLGIGAGFGDWGSGPDIVTEAVHAVAREHVGLGRPTALTTRCLERAGTDAVEQFLEQAWRQQRSGLTPTDVWAVAATGDPVAVDIADRVAASLAGAAGAVARKLGLDAPGTAPFDVVLSGGVLAAGDPVLEERMRARLAALVPAGRPVRQRLRPVVGGVLLAADAVGGLTPGFDRTLRSQAGGAR